MRDEPDSATQKMPPSASVGLVQANATDALAGTRSRKVILWTVLTVFLGALVATLAIDTLFPVPRPQPVGQEKARDVRRHAEARFRDGSLAKLAEYELRLTSRVRETLVPGYAWLLYDWLGETRGFTVAGDDGWFFLPTRIETNPRSAAEHANIASNLVAAVSRRLHGFGSQLLVVPVPRKAVVYREALPKNRPCRPELYDALVTGLKRRGISVVDLLTPFRDARDEPVFFRMDTHWSDAGQVLAARLVALALRFQIPGWDRLTELRRGDPVDEPGDILRQLGIRVEKGRRPAGMSWPTYTPVVVHHPERGELHPRFSISNLEDLVLTGTSYSRNRRLGTYISHFTDRPVSVAAWAGEPSSVSLARALSAAGSQKRYPKHVIWEFPTIEIFCPPIPFYELGQFFCAAPPPRVSVLGDFAGKTAPQLFEKGLGLKPGANRITSTWTMARLRAGAFQHSGDGVLAMRLRGRVSGGSIRVQAGSQSFVFEGRWNADTTEVVMPLMAQHPTDTGYVMLSAEGSSVDLQLESLEIVTDLDQTTLVAAAIAPLERDRSTWHQAARYETPVAITPHCALVVQMSTRGLLVGDVTVRVFTTGEADPTLETTLTGMGPMTTILLDLGKLSGRHVTHLAVRGTGTALTQAISAAGIVKPF